MTLRGWLLGAGTSIACFAIMLWYVNSGTSRRSLTRIDSADANSLRAPSNPDAQRVAKLEQEVKRLQRLVAQQQQANSLSSVATGGQAPRDITQGESQAEPNEDAVVQAFWEKLDQRLQTESVEPAWRDATQKQLNAVLPEKLGDGYAVAEANCASSTCRVVLNHPTQERIPQTLLAGLAVNLYDELGAWEYHFDSQSPVGQTRIFMLKPRHADPGELER